MTNSALKTSGRRSRLRARFATVISGALVFFSAAVAIVAHITARTEMRAMDEVCGLIRANYFRLDQPDVQAFLKRCETESGPFTFSRAKAIQHINAKLSSIKSSHLVLYSPVENRWLWENEGSDTGIRARLIDGELVIIDTLEQSPARRARLKAGDVIVAINGEATSSSSDAQSTPGLYKIARGHQVFLAELKLDNVHEDLSPQLEIETMPRTAVLKIPSFLPVYFEKDAWSRIAKQLGNFKHLAIDLRGNAGGSFPAMLRALSPFFCRSEKEIGRLERTPRGNSQPPRIMSDDLSAESQLQQITASDEVILKTFGDDYGCFDGSATVLIDNGTSSVSEIFVQALTERPRTRVWGWVSAGQVVMARWFSIGSLGGGDYAMSIPIAGFRTEQGREIERVGVRPSRELSYDLETALHGQDSWLNAALVSF